MSIKTLRTHYVSVGVIGHIDHGKTTLVGKLTGTETDTQPEEKRRGITIDLGFAYMADDEYTFAFIDAPGHQKYVGNLLAGVSAVDIGLLVVACDQGIQEQTLEHVAILSKLGVPQLIVALARTDLCEASQQSELREELLVFLEDFGFRDFPVVALSSVTGEGLDDMKRELRAAAERTQPKRAAVAERNSSSGDAANRKFRMPIDRVLNVEGRGLVAAGTIWHGEVHLGDQLTIAGRDQEFRVREIEVHGQSVDESSPGIRTALNLAGPETDGVQRGDELISPGSFPMSNRLLVALSMFPEAKPLRLPITAQMHLATNAVTARLLGGKSPPVEGEDTVVIVETKDPIVAEFQQQCLFRSPYPVGSFAGGRILARLDDLPRLRRRISNSAWIEMGKNLPGKAAEQRLLLWVEQLGELKLDVAWLERQLGIAPVDCEQLIASMEQIEGLLRLGDLLVTQSQLSAVGDYLMKSMAARTEMSDDAWWAIDSIVEHTSHLASAEVTRAVVGKLIKENHLVELNKMLAVASEQTKLSKKQRATMEKLLELYANNRTPPTFKQLCDQLSLNKDAAQSLLRHATQQRLLIDLSNGLYIDSQVLLSMVTELASQFEHEPNLTVPQIKDIWGVTRKHVIPLLEYCDQHQLTYRDGDVRLAGKGLQDYLQQTIGDPA